MIQDAVTFLSARIAVHPKVAVVLGSGLGAFADEVESPIEVPYTEIPGWPKSTAVGHAGKLVFGRVAGVEAVVQSGRAHLYEGYTPQQVAYAVRVFGGLGVEAFLFTNAAGG